MKLVKDIKLGDFIWIYNKSSKEINKVKVCSISLGKSIKYVSIFNREMLLTSSYYEDIYNIFYVSECSIIKIKLDIEKSQLAKYNKAMIDLNKKIVNTKKNIEALEKEIKDNPSLYE